jgi:hypothetical protein
VWSVARKAPSPPSLGEKIRTETREAGRLRVVWTGPQSLECEWAETDPCLDRDGLSAKSEAHDPVIFLKTI